MTIKLHIKCCEYSHCPFYWALYYSEYLWMYSALNLLARQNKW